MGHSYFLLTLGAVIFVATLGPRIGGIFAGGMRGYIFLIATDRTFMPMISRILAITRILKTM